jgi:hypothetical protein
MHGHFPRCLLQMNTWWLTRDLRETPLQWELNLKLLRISHIFFYRSCYSLQWLRCCLVYAPPSPITGRKGFLFFQLNVKQIPITFLLFIWARSCNHNVIDGVSQTRISETFFWYQLWKLSLFNALDFLSSDQNRTKIPLVFVTLYI